jgi:hypothetical protein
MAPRKKAGGGKRTDTEVTIIIENFDPTDEQLEKIKAVAKGLAPEFLTKIIAPGKQSVVAVNNKRHHCK